MIGFKRRNKLPLECLARPHEDTHCAAWDMVPRKKDIQIFESLECSMFARAGPIAVPALSDIFTNTFAKTGGKSMNE